MFLNSNKNILPMEVGLSKITGSITDIQKNMITIENNKLLSISAIANFMSIINDNPIF